MFDGKGPAATWPRHMHAGRLCVGKWMDFRTDGLTDACMHGGLMDGNGWMCGRRVALLRTIEQLCAFCAAAACLLGALIRGGHNVFDAHPVAHHAAECVW
eukprot:363348-Chlamydomonas_euryale.AAC.2